MKTVKRPGPWTLIDAVTFGALAVLAVIGAGIATFYIQGAEEKAILWVCAAMFIGIYLGVVRSRWLFLKKYSITLPLGIYVNSGEYVGSIGNLTTELIDELQDMVTRLNGVTDNKTESLALEDPIWVQFVQGTINGGNSGYVRLAGYMIRGSDGVVIATFSKVADGTFIENDQMPVANSAFAHELSHVILQRYGVNDTEKEHALMREVGI